MEKGFRTENIASASDTQRLQPLLENSIRYRPNNYAQTASRAMKATPNEMPRIRIAVIVGPMQHGSSSKHSSSCNVGLNQKQVVLKSSAPKKIAKYNLAQWTTRKWPFVPNYRFCTFKSNDCSGSSAG